EVVGERMKLEPHRVGGERSARQSRPLDRAFALLDPLLARPALVVESNDALGRAAHVRHDEADAGIKFSGMPLDLGDNPPRLGPGSGLIAEIGLEPAHMVRRKWRRADAPWKPPFRENSQWQAGNPLPRQIYGVSVADRHVHGWDAMTRSCVHLREPVCALDEGDRLNVT